MTRLKIFNMLKRIIQGQHSIKDVEFTYKWNEFKYFATKNLRRNITSHN